MAKAEHDQQVDEIVKRARDILKAARKCKACSKSSPPDSNFCQHCGIELEHLINAVEEKLATVTTDRFTLKVPADWQIKIHPSPSEILLGPHSNYNYGLVTDTQGQIIVTVTAMAKISDPFGQLVSFEQVVQSVSSRQWKKFMVDSWRKRGMSITKRNIDVAIDEDNFGALRVNCRRATFHIGENERKDIVFVINGVDRVFMVSLYPVSLDNQDAALAIGERVARTFSLV